jgi:hypothetical protein
MVVGGDTRRSVYTRFEAGDVGGEEECFIKRNGILNTGKDDEE